MPSSDAKIVDYTFAKRLTIINALVPAVLLGIDALTHRLGVNEVNFAIRTTGLVGLVLLVLSLAITPLRKLTGWNSLIAIRRNLGVIGFLYIAAHFIIFFLGELDGSVGATLSEIIERPYLWFGFGALVLMIPLALTSTDAMVRRVGGKRWKRLHRLAYPAVIAGVIHYILLVKSDIRQPAAFAIVLGGLLAYRVVSGIAKRAKPTQPTKRFWSGELRLAQITDETHDVRTFRFVNPAGGPLPFQHVAGQYLNLKLTIDGKRVNRSYTIASPPTRNDYCEISVKKAANGYGSKHLHETWKPGDVIPVSAPAGRFTFAGHEAQRVVLIAGGIGITPMMSVIRSLTDRGWGGDLYLVFSVRLVKDIVFRDELAELQAKNPKLHVRITISGDAETPWDGVRGNVTRELLEGFIPDLGAGPIMLCGPDRMMTAMRALLVGLGVPDAQIHQEAFISPAAVAEVAANPSGGEEPPLSDGQVAALTFQRSGTTTETSQLTILEAAEEAAVEIPFECRSGICGQCKVKLVSGNVRMETQDALSASERSRGLILACQARPTRDCVVDA
ncbi:MAG: ferric reductase-like transmembrane domain-containing protein [Deltaproteobacteria bacterium]|nr:ferric reductase-like transmembrane domain-containing protein [Deltaproteobacteria bacterium]